MGFISKLKDKAVGGVTGALLGPVGGAVGAVVGQTGIDKGLANLGITSEPPPTPDYKSAAEATAAGNLALAEQVTASNRPDEYTPEGSKTWSQDPETGKWTSTVSLNEPQQEIFDANTDFLKSISGIRDTALEGAKGTLETPFSISSDVPSYSGPTSDMPSLGKTAEDDIPSYAPTSVTIPTFAQDITSTPSYSPATGEIPSVDITSGLGQFSDYSGPTGNMPTLSAPNQNMPSFEKPQGNIPTFSSPEGGVPTYGGLEGDIPQYDDIKTNVRDSLLARVEADSKRDREQRHAQLISQGIPPGSEAYIDEMTQFDRQLTDARQQAEVTSSQIASTEYQNRLSGRKQQQSEVGTEFDKSVISRQLTSGEGKDQFIADMQSRGMSFDEAAKEYDVQIQQREILFNEGKDVFLSEMQKRGMSLDESTVEYNAQLQKRGTLSQENIQQFQGDLSEYGMKSEQAQKLFDNSVTEFGIDSAKAKDKFAGDIQSYSLNREKALDSFAANLQKYGIERDEVLDLFSSEMQTRGLETEEETIRFNAAMQTNDVAIKKQILERSIPLNELQVLSGGQTVNMPNVSPGGQMPMVAGPDYLNAEISKGMFDLGSNNAQIAQRNNILQGLFGVGASAIGKP